MYRCDRKAKQNKKLRPKTQTYYLLFKLKTLIIKFQEETDQKELRKENHQMKTSRCGKMCYPNEKRNIMVK